MFFPPAPKFSPPAPKFVLYDATGPALYRRDEMLVVLQLEEQTAENFMFETARGAAADATARSHLVYIRSQRKKLAQKQTVGPRHFSFPSVCVPQFQVCVAEIKYYISCPLRCLATVSVGVHLSTYNF
jgi:hypothetical protein